MMTSQNKVSVQFRFRFRDFLDSYRLYRAAATKEKDSHTIIGFLLLFLSGSYFALRVIRPITVPSNTIDLSLVLASIVSLLGLISLFDLLPIASSWLRFRHYNQQNRTSHELVFDENGIQYQNQSAVATYEWNFYQEAVEGKTVFVLTYGRDLYFAVPKSAFQTKNEINIFREMLKNHLTSFKQELRI